MSESKASKKLGTSPGVKNSVNEHWISLNSSQAIDHEGHFYVAMEYFFEAKIISKSNEYKSDTTNKLDVTRDTLGFSFLGW